MMISALLCGQKNMSVLGVVMSAPLIFPVFIFGVGAAKNFPENGIMALEFQALAGLCLLSIAVAIPAAAVALKANIDT
jgi:ABC-type transport system involved in cytochrome c biogenesis permease component